MASLRESFLGQAWLVLVLALVFGGTLAGVQVGLQDRIEANLRAETLGRIPSLVLGSEVDIDAEVGIEEDRLEVPLIDGSITQLQIAESEIAGHQVFEVFDSDSQDRLGWVARGAGQGYADQIEILVGLRPDGSEITGLYVLSQKETPALGDGITKAPFRSRFEGVPTDRPLEVAREERVADGDASKILALTAATISSQSVCDIVNRTVEDLAAEFRQ